MLDVAALPVAVFLLTPPSSNLTQTSAQDTVYKALPSLKKNGSNLKVEKLSVSSTGNHILLQQQYKGIPVLGGHAIVHNDKNGRPYAITSQMETASLNIDLNPKISAAAAASLLQKTESRAAGVNTQLIIIPNSKGAQLAWKASAPSLSGPSWQMYIDAQSGKVIGQKADNNRYVEGPRMGQVFNVNASVSVRHNDLKDNNGRTDAVPESAYIMKELLGLTAGSDVLTGLFASSKASSKQQKATDGNFVFKRGQAGFTETMAYFYFDYAQRFIQSLGFTNVNNRQVSFAVDRLTADNSFYSPDTKQISFGSGGVDDAEDAEVILHELGHAIQDNQVENFGDHTDGRAMGEGFGDFFAAATLAPLSDGFQDDCIAEWDAVAYSDTQPPCLRRLDSTKVYPDDMEHQEHADGEIWSAMLWDTYQAFGREKSVQLVLESHFYLTSRARFKDGAKALLTAADKLKFSAQDVENLKAVLEKRGFTANRLAE